MTDKEKELADKRFEMQGIVGDEAFLKAREQVRENLEEIEKKKRTETIAVLDKLGGKLRQYVEEYLYVTYRGHPYDLDYEISADIVSRIIESYKSDISGIWYYQITKCNSISELPTYLQKLILQFLPVFFEEYPQYKDAPCLQIKNTDTTFDTD